ncbi:GATA zinc finger domain-containing protein 8 [Choanephora cucurbitarum]|uniref:GATA zinc finger domain-containing protein 8 n=1 Tax=Choanephora cucurbitarum TaxID=101091 RepID=A0A1C7N3W3_9FUNG|nr:GATA zinc finger domain-containing protein 8 [Choanephora cucurbitarum]
MDVAQLCTDPLEPSPSLISTNHEENSSQRSSANVNKIDFLLSGYQESDSTTTTTTTTATEIPNSIKKVLIQCSQLCEDIWQLKLHNKSMSDQERDETINHLSEAAQIALKAIQSSEYYTADNQKRRNSNANMSLSQDEDEEEEEEEDEEDDFRSIHTSTINDYAEYQLIRQARNIQSNSRARPRYRRRNRRSMIGQKCHSCNTTETPEWRRGPDGARTLCNACGLHYSKLLKKGSIGVQTQNYLITGGVPKVSSSSKQTAANTLKNYRPTEGNTINYPFVLMDPRRNANNEELKQEAPTSRSYQTSVHPQHLAPATIEDFVNINQNNASYSNRNSRKSNSNGSASIGPLRIHQWKHQ